MNSTLWSIEKTVDPRNGTVVLSPEYNALSEDGVSKGKLAMFWDGAKWVDISDSHSKLIKAISQSLMDEAKKYVEQGDQVQIKSPQFKEREQDKLNKFVRNFQHNKGIQFDTKVIFDDQPITRSMYATTQLDYHPQDIPTPYFDKAMDLWYGDYVEEILWFTGAAITGKSLKNQKMLFIRGVPGTGKSTYLDILEALLGDYARPINLQTFTDKSSDFGKEQFKNAPVLIDRDADIRSMSDKITFNKLLSHEMFSINPKGKSHYDDKFTGVIFAASNYDVQMGNTDKDGTARRLAIVYSSGKTMPSNEYDEALSHIMNEEIPGIAYKAIQTFNKLGERWSQNLTVDNDMYYKTNLQYQFIRDAYVDGLIGEKVTLTKVSELYKEFLEENNLETRNYRNRIKESMLGFYKFAERDRVNGKSQRNVFYEPDVAKILGVNKQNERDIPKESDNKSQDRIRPEFISEFNYFEHSTFPGQETNDKGNPKFPWDKVVTTAADINQRELHYIRAPKELIRIDFDADTLDENIKLAEGYPETYGEISKSGKGIHLWYFYDGDDVETLVRHISPEVEIKINTGKAGVRRKFTHSNGVEQIATMRPSDLSHKETSMLKDTENMFHNEQTLRAQIQKSLRKENTGSTITEVQFIKHLLDEAISSGKDFDVKDLRQQVLTFATRSRHQADKALQIFAKMEFSSKEEEEQRAWNDQHQGFVDIPDKELVFFDIESIPDLFMVSYTEYDTGKPVTLIEYEPLNMHITREQIDKLLARPLVGFNNLRYDNHIMYGAHLGKDAEKLYYQSKHLVTHGDNSGTYNAAYQLAYTDLYDLIPDKQSLKKWEIEMGMKHNELDVDWNATAQENADRLGVPVEQFIETMAEYNRDDVLASNELFHYRYADYEARKMLAELTNMPVSSTTNTLSAQFIFGNDNRPQDKLVYTDLREKFPGYTYEYDPKTKKIVNEYRGFDPSNGGFVYTNPGVHKNVVELDVSSMHPHSAIALGYFGPYASRFEELVAVVGLLKHPTDENLAQVKQMLGGALAPYIKEGTNYKGLRYSLKIVINATYGMSSAKFDNKFRSPKNVDNIIAKRGALYMIDLKYHIESLGYTVVHIKTDSIKVSNADETIINDIQEFARSYGYEMEIAGMYDRMVLIDKAQLIGHNKGEDENSWHAIGAEFAQPFVYKTLFDKSEPLYEKDYLITKTTKAGPMYLGDEFIGKAGEFYPSKTGLELTWAKTDEETGEVKHNSVTGAKGFKWRLSTELTKDDIDMSYFDQMLDTSIEKIKSVGDIKELLPDFEDDTESLDAA